MFCPGCGSEERQASQYCRACGTDLRPVRLSVERPDSVTASAVSAREDIGRAVAERIRAVSDARELKKVAEDVLPEIEKFLESYEEKRLRRVRAGVVTAASGLGATAFMLLMSAVARGPDSETFIGVSGLGVAAFLIGLGLIINALFFTKPRNRLDDHSFEARSQNLLDAGYAPAQVRASVEASPTFKSQTTSNLTPAAGSSITEHTTHHLKTER
jgi:hypothetical protein